MGSELIKEFGDSKDNKTSVLNCVDVDGKLPSIFLFLACKYRNLS